MKLILASTSRFKKEILNKVGLKHESLPSKELDITNTNPYEYVKELAYNKALSVKDTVDESKIIIGLDTIVVIDNKIIEKPKSIDEAKNNLRIASNNTTKVITGYALINKELQEEIIGYQETIVSFNTITEDDIEFYINNEPDALYVSGFVIETICSNFINKIEGSYYNILGVPVEKIYETLQKWNISLKDL